MMLGPLSFPRFWRRPLHRLAGCPENEGSAVCYDLGFCAGVVVHRLHSTFGEVHHILAGCRGLGLTPADYLITESRDFALESGQFFVV